ncbi:MAG: YkgJ family cysteine cluster protein [Candidatus Delongbacteria bacterium]|nr:YkgJ family cysteine cluster protein [Candidatus Delongbacteria bacterium]MBN2836869.1 YkgJ family cysteine cluster protein [Candidatus Delongbacteria bacterium]
MSNLDIFSEYKKLIKECDDKAKIVTKIFRDNLSCQKGCFSCCKKISVFPVEFDFIKLMIGPIEKSDIEHKGLCSLLDSEGNCRIYKYRPIICRTHGYPSFFKDDNKWQITYCELNFTKKGNYSFNNDNSINLDLLNARLAIINHNYLENTNYKGDDRIELGKLVE